MMVEDTICAIATAAGSGAIAVIRVSGKDTFIIADKILNRQKRVNGWPIKKEIPFILVIFWIRRG